MRATKRSTPAARAGPTAENARLRTQAGMVSIVSRASVNPRLVVDALPFIIGQKRGRARRFIKRFEELAPEEKFRTAETEQRNRSRSSKGR